MRLTSILFLIVAFVCRHSNAQEDYVSAIMGALDNPEMLTSMVLNTGKSISDLGDINTCNVSPHTKYIVLYFKLLPIYQGIWLPKEWNHENLAILRDAVQQMALEAGITNEAIVYIPSEDRPSVTIGNAIGFVFFGLLLWVCIGGMIVEYTNLFENSAKPVGYENLNDSEQDIALLKSKSRIGKTLLSFSIARNLRKLFYTPQKETDFLSVMNGVRVISMAYIILGHWHEIVPSLPLKNSDSIPELVQEMYTSVVSGGFYSVDVFFYFSAFLGAYLMVLKFENSRKINFAMVYFHRLFRLVPTLLLFIGLLLTFYIYMGEGPWWNAIQDLIISPCKKYWWTTVLFVNNFYPPRTEPGCLTQLWYLSNDMLYFVFLPFVVLAYIKNRKVGYTIVWILLLANVIVTFVVSEVGDHPITIFKDLNPRTIYHQPTTRFGAYVVGILFGFLYHEYMKAKKYPELNGQVGARFYNHVYNSKSTRLAFYLVSSFFMVFLILIPHSELKSPEKVWPQFLSSLFNSLHRIVFVASMGLFLASPMVGRNPFMRSVLGGKFWAPWAKLTFMAYLWHVLVIGFILVQLHTAYYFTKKTILFTYFTAVFLTYLVWIPLSLLIEAPIMQLERLVLLPPKTKRESTLLQQSSENFGLLNKSDMNSKQGLESSDTRV